MNATDILQGLTGIVANRTLHSASSHLRRQPSRWAFGSLPSWWNNAWYLFIHVIENHPDIEAAWIAADEATYAFLADRDLPVYRRWSLGGMCFCATAVCHITDNRISNINYPLAGGALYINLWHGIPLKRIEFDCKPEPLQKPSYKRTSSRRWFRTSSYYQNWFHPSSLADYAYREYKAVGARPDMLLVPSKRLQPTFESAFRTSADACWTGGYPRNDVLGWSRRRRRNYLSRYAPGQAAGLFDVFDGYDRVYLWAPTFRDTGTSVLRDAAIDWAKLTAWLRDNNALFLIKAHVASSKDEPGYFGNASHSNMPHSDVLYSTVRLLDRRVDLYAILPDIDGLVTDYSSIYFDFLLVDRPILFFPFDRISYENQRGFYFDYDDVTPGPKVYDGGDLADGLAQMSNDTYQAQRRALTAELWSTTALENSERLVQHLRRLEEQELTSK